MFFEKNKYYVFVKYKNMESNYYSADNCYYRNSRIALLIDLNNFDEACDYIVDHYTDIFTFPERIDDYAICYFNKENELITLTNIKSKLDKGSSLYE